MRSFIILLKKIGLQKIVAVTIAATLILIAGIYVYTQPKILNKNLQSSFDKGEYSKSIPELEKFIASNTGDTNAMELLGALYIQKASREPESKLEYISKATKILNETIAIDPQRSESYRLLGTIELLNGNTAKAESKFRKAMNVSSNTNVNAQLGLAMIFESKGDWKAAAAAYKIILEKDPTNESAILGRARFYIFDKNTDTATNEVQAVLASSTNSAIKGEAYHILGTIDKLAKKYSTAKKYFEDSLEFRPNNAHTLVLLGESYIGLYPQIGKERKDAALKEILEIANKAVTLHPDYIHAYTLLYKVNLLQKKYAEANTVAKKIVSMLQADKTLSPSQKEEYKKFYSEELTNIQVKSSTINGALQKKPVKN